MQAFAPVIASGTRTVNTFTERLAGTCLEPRGHVALRVQKCLVSFVSALRHLLGKFWDPLLANCFHLVATKYLLCA